MITSAISKHTRQPPAQFHVCCKDRNLSRTDTNVRDLVFCLFLQAVHISCQRSTLVISTGLESTSSLSNPKETMGSASKCQKTPISQRDNGQMLQACFWSRDISTQIKSDWPQCVGGVSPPLGLLRVKIRERVLSVAWVALISRPCPYTSSAFQHTAQTLTSSHFPFLNCPFPSLFHEYF